LLQQQLPGKASIAKNFVYSPEIAQKHFDKLKAEPGKVGKPQPNLQPSYCILIMVSRNFGTKTQNRSVLRDSF